MNHSTEFNEPKTTTSKIRLNKKCNQSLANKVPKSNSQIPIKKDLRSIISSLKSEIINLSLDKTGRRPNRDRRASNNSNKSFNDNHNVMSTESNIMTDINYTIAPLKQEPNELCYNDLLFQYNKLIQECESLRKNKHNTTMTESKQPLLTTMTHSHINTSKRKNKIFHKSNSVLLTESNAKESKKSILHKSDIGNKTIKSRNSTSNINNNNNSNANTKHTVNNKMTPHSIMKKDNRAMLQIKEYQNEIMKLKEDNKALVNKCNEFNQTIMRLIKDNKEYETLLDQKNDVIEKQSKVIETLTTQSSIQISNVYSNERVIEDI